MVFPAESHSGSQLGCLLIHGYGGSPLEMQGIAQALREEGVTVSLPCLPGHGPDAANFAAFRFGDWLAFVERELAALKAKCDTVALVGFSMGGTLALNLASRFPVAGVAAISTPLYVLHVSPWPWTHAVFYASSGLAQLGKILGNKPSGGVASTKSGGKGYAGPFSLAQLYSFRKGCIATRKLLPGLNAPLLLLHDVDDRIVYAGNACEIARRASSQFVTVRFTRIGDPTTRHHMILTHRETEGFVTKTVTEFCLSCCR